MLPDLLAAVASDTARGRRIIPASWSISDNVLEDILFYAAFSTQRGGSRQATCLSQARPNIGHYCGQASVEKC
jgi:hypothetical protein